MLILHSISFMLLIKLIQYFCYRLASTQCIIALTGMFCGRIIIRSGGSKVCKRALGTSPLVQISFVWMQFSAKWCVGTPSSGVGAPLGNPGSATISKMWLMFSFYDNSGGSTWTNLGYAPARSAQFSSFSCSVQEILAKLVPTPWGW